MTEEDFATMTTAFFPPTEHQLTELSGIKFWPSVCSFYGECNQTKIQMYNQAAAEEAGAEFYFGTTAEYIIMENGAVAGLVASDADGYVKITCKAVVCACGGMGGNPDMMAYFMPDMAQALVEGESLNSMSANDGRGVQMAYWAGAHLETTPIPGMNMKGPVRPRQDELPAPGRVDRRVRAPLLQRVLPHQRAARVSDHVHEPQDEVRRVRQQLHRVPPVHPAPARRLHRQRGEHRLSARGAGYGLRQVQGHLRGAGRGRGPGRPGWRRPYDLR